jgi:hypothetical protein
MDVRVYWFLCGRAVVLRFPAIVLCLKILAGDRESRKLRQTRRA